MCQKNFIKILKTEFIGLCKFPGLENSSHIYSLIWYEKLITRVLSYTVPKCKCSFQAFEKIYYVNGDP